ncbi:MAG: flagellar basal-body rod protein FlgF [Desulfobulbaceae bacterium A2]|nr:MAG: flagellar basal-body rod protein FlgF [Desulfobulbaceae bacterium A2]
MGSGKYSALAGAVSQEQAMASITNNLANVNSTGFKKDRLSFESLLRDARQTEAAQGVNYTRIRSIQTDHSEGPLRATGNDLDLAIHGDAFFKVQDSQGNAYYTRKGSFMVNSNSELSTDEGYLVLGEGGGPVTLPSMGGKPVAIAENGLIVLDGAEVGQVGLFAVEDPSQLVKKGNALFTPPPDGTERPVENTRIIQGHLEMSNVNMVEEMALMIDTTRKHETLHKVLKSYSTLAEKQDELGTVS